jgi:predicted lysophospholipase L1 biosynthesis ABC-type transport system permease subunit
VAGRPLVQADRGTDNVVVNVRAAVEYLPDGRAVGQPIVRGNRQGTVVGVLADSFDTALDTAPRPTLFAYLGALPTGSRVNFVLRTTEPLDVVRRQVERALMTVNRSAIVTDVSLLGDRLSDSIRDRTFATVVLSIFAVAGISVCAAGLIGIVSFVIARRTREIAIRTAIGAEPRHVRRFVVREALSAALTGAAVGLAAAWWVSRWLESLVYGIEPRDTTTLMGGAVVMLVLVYVASWLPARRALRLSPTIALRAE